MAHVPRGVPGGWNEQERQSSVVNPFARRPGPDVSIIIATYNTGERLGPVIDALDALEMEPGDLEVIFVDDGSTDDTFATLKTACRQRRHFHAERIPNSGWPSRPRNVGLDRARGEFVFFMDHDDYVFPDGMPAAVAYAREHALDYLAPKEVVAGWSAPGWSCFRENITLADGVREETLQCVTPHKLYRRQFLLDNDVRFPENIKRLEDFNLNGQVLAAGARAGVFAERPVYRWELHGGNAHTGKYDVDEYWKSFDQSLEAVREVADQHDRDTLLARWFRTLVLDRVGPLMFNRSAQGRADLITILDERLGAFPESVDTRMSPLDRARALALRYRSVPALLDLAHASMDFKLIARHTWASWAEGRLTLGCEATVRTENGRGLALVVDEDGPAFLLPPVMAQVVGQDRLALGDDVARLVPEFAIRHRDSNVDWSLPSVSDVEVREEDGVPVLVVRIEATFDPSLTPFDGPLAPGIYDVFHRVDKLGFVPTSRVRANDVEDVLIVDAEREFNVYATTQGFLALDTLAQARTSAPRVEDGAWASGTRAG
ncbi:glycosyltransferase family 2 protein [Demequina sp.]|uniref:glycosyltransferase family 2 protein n=1 Tax=Demequina sp. TaxID=2050685 RepID=UPI003A86D9FE